MKVVTKPLPQPFRVQIVEDDLKYVETVMEKVWDEVKDQIDAPGFRKGQVPRSVAEKKIGLEPLYRSGLNVVLNKGLSESGLSVFEVLETAVEWHTDKQPLIMTVTCHLNPAVIAANYTDLKLDYKEMTVAETEVDSTLERLAFSEGSEIEVTGPVTDDNIAHVTFAILDPKTKKSLAIQKNYPARATPNRFGFEATLLTHIAGDKYEVPVTLPADYFNAPLRNKAVIIAVEVHKVVKLEIPPIDEALAVKIGYKSLSEMRAAIRTDLEKDKKKADSLTFRDAVLSLAISKTEFTPLPDNIVKKELDNILAATVDDTNRRMKTKLTIEQALSHMGITKEHWCIVNWQRGVRKVHLGMMLDYITQQNALTATNEEAEKELTAILPPNVDRKNVNMADVLLYVERRKAQEYLVDLVNKANQQQIQVGASNG